jgi:hypothetical protein
MKLNWKRFAVMFVLLNIPFLLGGCGWVSAANALWPAITTAVTAIFSFLTNLSISNPTLLKIQQDVEAALTEGKTILAELAQDTSTTVVAKFENVLNAIVQSLDQILTGVGVTDPTKLSTLEKLIALGVAALQAVLGILPLASKVGSLNDLELAHADKAASTSLKLTHQVLQHSYHALVSTSTGDIATDEALAALPQQLP